MDSVVWLKSIPVKKVTALVRWEQIATVFKKTKSSREMKAAPVYEKLSDFRNQERAEILSRLHARPVSRFMHSFFHTLAEGSSDREIESFIKGMKRFAGLVNLAASERAEYYGHPLLGLHSQNSFSQLWNSTYPDQSITVWDIDFKRQCPPSWSIKLQKGVWILSYCGEAPITQGLNELIQGPTTLDCGMFCELLIWIAIRHLLGDVVFDKVFKFDRGGFTLTQSWNVRGSSSEGNTLYPFYDIASVWEVDEDSSQKSVIHTRTVFNHHTYLAKHPGGEARLHNGTQIDGCYLIFDPAAPTHFLSQEELEERLLQRYNAPRSVADLERLWLYSRYPQVVHPAFVPKTFGILAAEARRYEHHVLTKSDWEECRPSRTQRADRFRFRFNFQRLVDSVTETEEACLDDAITRAKQKQRDFAEREKSAAIDHFIQPVREGLIFSNMNMVHDMVNQGYVVAILGKAILQFRDGWAGQHQDRTKLKLFIAFVKLEEVTRPRLGTFELASGYNSAFPSITPQMLKAMESDSSVVSLCLLNPAQSERKPNHCVHNKMIGDTVCSKYDHLAVPYIVLSKGPRGIDFHFDVTFMEPMTYETMPANERPVVHMLFDLQSMDNDALERDNLDEYLGWENCHSFGISYLYTHRAVHESAESATSDATM